MASSQAGTLSCKGLTVLRWNIMVAGMCSTRLATRWWRNTSRWHLWRDQSWVWQRWKTLVGGSVIKAISWELRRGDLLLRVDGVHNVYWLFGLEGLEKYRCDLVTDRICGLGRDRIRTTAGAKAGVTARGTPFSAEVEALPKEPSVEERQAHELTHLPARSWCETCVKSFGLGDPHRLREVVVTYQRYRSTTYLWTTGGEKELICAPSRDWYGVLSEVVIRADKRPIDSSFLASWSFSARFVKSTSPVTENHNKNG